MVSQVRQLNFSRTVWTTFHRRGTTSSVSVIVSPSLTSLPLQQGQAIGPGMTTRSRGRWAGGSGSRTGLARMIGRGAGPGGSIGSTPASAASASSSSSCSSSWSSSLRLRSEVGPNRSRCSLAISSLRWAIIASAPVARASADCLAVRSATSARAQGIDVVGQEVGVRAHACDSTTSEPACVPARCPQPAASGRQVRCGCRQSIPSSSIESIAGVSATTPFCACGQMKRPRSSRLA